MTDEPRWRRVEDALQTEAAARRDSDDLILVIGRPSFGERTQHRPLQFDALAIVRVATANDLVDKTAVATKVVEVTAATQEQRVLKPLLEMAVRTLDRAILVRDTQIVAGRCHAVVAHQFMKALRLVLRSVAIQVAECRRETVAAMLLRRSAEPPQRVLQSFRQCHIALATEHHMGVLVAREYETEVVEPMVKHDTQDSNAKLTRIGEVRQAKSTGGRTAERAVEARRSAAGASQRHTSSRAGLSCKQ